ncbi:calcium/sodium antiporter [Mediterraneibacter agrestimuris]|uniref:calcium/sodium antiporter n=1 Tax=Mediterraneibacter agrestimuris TaxID=2941333 RepID=UPI00203D9B46|nr:calcium/sodium antiporter [Mediterraneibacter agrestimuris]
MMYLLLLAGFFLLIKGADYFVEASSSVAKTLRVPSIIIGLTIVAFGTSAPELAVSVTAAMAGNNDIAVGNVIGSNLFNLLVVLGTCGLILPIKVKLRWDYFATALVTVTLFVLIAFDMKLGRIDGLFLLSVFVVFIGLAIRDALVNRIQSTEEFEVLSPLRCVVYIVGGLAAIAFGGELVVDNASKIAASFGLSQNLIGLTIVALGTSLPELVTSIVASRKGENGLAIGNVIGSNLFNIMMVLALSAVISPIPINPLSVQDTVLLIIATVITLILCRRRNEISRLDGAVMVGMYAAYMVFIIVR